jgi:hypothetical protein
VSVCAAALLTLLQNEAGFQLMNFLNREFSSERMTRSARHINVCNFYLKLFCQLRAKLRLCLPMQKVML